MTDKIKRGTEGEDLAAKFLMEKGYEIVARNFRYKRSEIDLIVQRDSWLVFVEVKTRSSSSFGPPELAVNDHQVNKILEGAESYVFEKDWRGQVRYDVVAITLRKDGSKEIHHIEDAFY